jgi:hypothetical protein
MDYRLKSIYEQMLVGKQKQPSNNLINKPAKSLKEAYKAVVLEQTQFHLKQPSPKDLEMLQHITGLADIEILNQLYNIYESAKKNNVFKQVKLSNGDYSYDMLVGMLDDKGFVVTSAPSGAKIRTRVGRGTTLGSWDLIKQQDVSKINELFNKITTEQITSTAANARVLRPLMVFELYKNYPDKVSTKQKPAPGIGPELKQVDTFNKILAEVGQPVKLILPGEDTEDPAFSVLFDNAFKIPDTGKADMALRLKDKEVFWISFKESSYIPPENDKQIPKFQQWGSLKTMYSNDNNVKELIDLYLTKSVAQLPNVFYTYDLKDSEALNQIKQKLIEMDPLVGERLFEGLSKRELTRAAKAHIVPSSSAMAADMGVNVQDRSTITSKRSNEKEIIINLLNVAFKAIYGMEFEMGKNIKFSRENVNVVIETPTPLKFEISEETEESPTALLNLNANSHILKNPHLPDSKAYFPYLYTRHTYKEKFEFNNIDTNQPEVILCGRVLIYPRARAIGDAKQNLIDLWS